MQSSSKQRLARHRPVKGVAGVYYSERQDGSKSFEVKYQDHSGAWKYETVGPRLDQAKQRLAEVTYKRTRGDVIASATITLSDLLPEWREARRVKPRTEQTQDLHVKLHIEPRLGRVKVRDINRAAVKAWLAGLRRHDRKPGPLSDGSKAVILASLSSILDHAVEAEVISANPIKSLKRQAKPHQAELDARILADAELAAMLAATNRKDGEPGPLAWIGPMIQTARYTGLRLGETCGLTWGQVDLDRNVLVIDRQFGKDDRIAETKSGKVREVPIFPTLRKVLVERKLAAGAVLPSAPVFPNRDGDFRSQGIVDRAFRKVRDRANLSVEPRGIRFHDLRHSYCSRLVAGGTPIATVQKWAGHASPATTYKYLHHVEAEGTYDLAAAACGAAL